MTAQAALAVEPVGHAGDAVVGRVAVGEAVRHDLVDRVLAAETLALGRAGFARQQAVGMAGGAPGALESDIDIARFYCGIERQVDEQVIAVRGAGDRGNAHARVLQRWFQIGDFVAMHHELDLVVLHAGPPERRLYTGDGRGLGVNGERRATEHEADKEMSHDVWRRDITSC